MTEERIKKLESIDGFSWTNNVWDTKYEELKEYANSHGHCRVPRNYAENKPLGKWVQKQRERYKMKHSAAKGSKQSPITDKQEEMLERIGFEWTIHKK